MELNRRNFLKFSSSFAIGAGLSTMIVNSLARSPAHRDIFSVPPKLIETFANSVCGECSNGCGVNLRLVDGIPVKVEGNKNHPMNKGGLCIRGQASLQTLYNPDRFKGPLKKIGTDLNARWQKTTWPTMIAELSSAITQLLNSNRPQDLVLIVDQKNTALTDVLKIFAHTIGTPHLYHIGFTKHSQNNMYPLFNNKFNYAIDFTNVKYVLSFGERLLESESTLGWFAPIWGQIKQSRTGERTKFVQIDPQLSVTGIKADEWIANNPGTFGKLALGVAHILILEDLYDHDFMEKNVHGFEDWTDSKGNDHIGVKNILLSKRYSPTSIAEISGVDPQTLFRIAREYANNRPAVALAGERCLWHSDGLFQSKVISLLNLLVGSVATKGGIIAIDNFITEFDFDKQSMTKDCHPGLCTITFADFLDLFDNKTFNPQILLNFGHDLIYASPDPKLKSLLTTIPLKVDFNSFPNESTIESDLILPDHTPFEKWQMTYSPPGFAGMCLSVSPPRVKPLFDTFDTCDLIIQVAKELPDVFADIPWENSEQYIRHVANKIYQTGTGHPFSEFDESWIKLLRERGWNYASHESFSDYWQEMIDQGGWQQLDYMSQKGTRAFTGKLGKINLEHVQNLLNTKLLSDIDPVKQEGKANTLSSLYDKEHTLSLNIYEINVLGRNGKGAYSPMLLEIFASHIKQKWDSWAEINPETANHLGLQENDWIWIVSKNKRLKTRVRLFPGTHPDIISIPLGLGHSNFGRFAKNVGINPIYLIESNRDKASGQFAWLETKVKILKSENGELDHA